MKTKKKRGKIKDIIELLNPLVCEEQGELFEEASDMGFDSIKFISLFMNSQTAKEMDTYLDHMQFAGKAYIMESFLDELKDKKILFDGDTVYKKDVMFWIGYLYRFWHFNKGESSEEIFKQADARKMALSYYPYHTFSCDMAIDELKEDYKNKLKKRKWKNKKIK